MRLFCDENIRDTTVQWLRDLGQDAVSVKEVGMEGAPDKDVFSYAIAENRVLLTFNADFADIRKLDTIDHPGIIRLRFKVPTEELVHPALKSALEKLQDEDTPGDLITVQQHKMRRRSSDE